MVVRAHLDPELAVPLDGFLAAVGGGFDLIALDATRATMNGLVAAVNAAAPPIDGVDATDRLVPGPAGAPDVSVRCYRPSDRRDPLPALVWLHGGGYVLGSVEFDDLGCRQLAKDLQAMVVSVNYRLAPEDPYPAAIEDCYAVLTWVAAEAAVLGVDARRVAIGGASAGGGLAAGLALLARDRGRVRPCFQLLVYPDLDDRTAGPACATRPETLFWTRANGLQAWQYYLGGRAGRADVPVYAAAARALDLAGLPPAYITVGALDPFLTENIRYAERLLAAGVATELHVYPAACHAFDVFAPMAGVACRFAAGRDDALKRAFAAEGGVP